MLRKMKTPVAILLLSLVAFTAFSTLTAPRAQALAPRCSGSYWSTDVESTFPYVGKDLAGHPFTYYWDLSIGSLRVCGTGQYEGRTSDKICLTVPPGSGWLALNLYNQWYTDGKYINENNYNFPISQTQSTTRCQYSGSWITPSGHTASIVGFTIAFDGSYPTGRQYITDTPR